MRPTPLRPPSSSPRWARSASSSGARPRGRPCLKETVCRAGAVVVRWSAAVQGAMWPSTGLTAFLAALPCRRTAVLLLACQPPPTHTPPARSAVLAHYLLAEKLNAFGVVGCLLCIAGSLAIVLHAPEERPISSVLQVWGLAVQPCEWVGGGLGRHGSCLPDRGLVDGRAWLGLHGWGVGTTSALHHRPTHPHMLPPGQPAPPLCCHRFTSRPAGTRPARRVPAVRAGRAGLHPVPHPGGQPRGAGQQYPGLRRHLLHRGLAVGCALPNGGEGGVRRE